MRLPMSVGMQSVEQAIVHAMWYASGVTGRDGNQRMVVGRWAGLAGDDDGFIAAECRVSETYSAIFTTPSAYWKPL
jgi:hypothetical protein